jgi:osmotically-inducible protein OsmY
VIVADGYVTLTGVVADPQQRGAAERAIRGLRGVRGVWNALKIGPLPQPVTAAAG